MRTTAISTGPDTHLDHLGVLAAQLEIPLIVTDRKTFELARTFYPQVQTTFRELEELTFDFFFANFDLIFTCGKFWCLEMQSIFELLYQKKIRIVFCPHGNSDKGATLKPSEQPPQDIRLIYGEQMYDLLNRTSALQKTQKCITTGNWRYPFYREYKSFYDTLAYEKVFATFDPAKKTILYAPTWSSKENPTSFYETCRELIEQLSDSYNLLIKLHPFLEEEQPAHLVHLQQLFSSRPHVIFVSNFPSLYPLLAKTDVYIGDFSSVGYDFLAFDRPLYFFNLRQNQLKPLLYKCGIEIPPEAHYNLRNFLLETLKQDKLSAKRQEIYNYAFGQERAISEIKSEIFAIEEGEGR